MKPEEQRIAIGQACNWVRLGEYAYRLPDGRKFHVDLLNDLNAMHEAEEARIRGHLDMEYREILERVRNEGYAAIVYATASQRAEAFLRTLGLWRE